MYIDQTQVRGEFLTFVHEVLKLAKELPSGYQAYRKWPKALHHLKASLLHCTAKELRVAFEYDDLEHWMIDFNYALSMLSSKNDFADRLASDYHKLRFFHNSNNYNLLRVPFICSILHHDDP